MPSPSRTANRDGSVKNLFVIMVSVESKKIKTTDMPMVDKFLWE